MLKIFFALVAFLLLALSPADAFRLRGSSNSGGGGGGNCPFGVSGDGCTASQTESNSGFVATGPPVANVNTMQHTNFFTGAFARQSGQSWGNTVGSSCTNANCHPPWNVAGVDYPVGIQATFSATLCGSTSATTLCDPTSATLPTGCTYCPSAFVGGGCTTGWTRQQVECHGQASYDIEGYDFSSTAHGCVALLVSSTVTNGTGTITIKNNKFGYTGINQCLLGTVSPTPASCCVGVVDVSDVSANIVNFNYNYMDLDGYDVSGAPCQSNNNTAFGADLDGFFSIVITYNAFKNSCSDFMFVGPGSVGNTSIVLYNYMQGVYCKQAGHCHIEENSGNSWAIPPNTITAEYSGYNTFLTNNGDYGGTGMNWTDVFNSNTTITDLWRYNNVLVGNTLANDPTTCGGPCLWDGLNYHETGIITNLHELNNYYDPSGNVISCGFYEPSSGTPTATVSGNIDMLTGQTVNVYTNVGGQYATVNTSGSPC